MQALINAVSAKYNGVIINGGLKFSHGQAEFFMDDGVIYRESNWKYPPRFQLASSMEDVDKFVETHK